MEEKQEVEGRSRGGRGEVEGRSRGGREEVERTKAGTVGPQPSG